jgi:hypothetical protein
MKYRLILTVFTTSLILSGCVTEYDYMPTSYTAGTTKDMALAKCNIEADIAWDEYRRNALLEAKMREQQAIANAPKSYDTSCSKIGFNLNCTTTESPFSSLNAQVAAGGYSSGTSMGLALSHSGFIDNRVKQCMVAKGFKVIEIK